MGDKIIDPKAELIKMAQAIDCFTWVTQNKLHLGHAPYKIAKHEYQVAWLQETAPRQCFIKGAQIGATECLVLSTLHGMIHGRYPRGALYLFPTRDDVGDFSQTRFDPLIEQNDFINHYVRGTHRKNVKKIGNAHLYLRGARSTKNIGGKKSSSQLKSIPADRVVFDEMDEIEDTMVELAKERVSSSPLNENDPYGAGELVYLGTPTIPDYGIDEKYQQSDQRVWMVRCHSCGKAHSLDQEFPNCLMRKKDGTIYRGCVHCGAEVYPRDGFWEPMFPNRSEELVGWWISQLNSMFVNPALILELYENPPHGDLSEVMNSKLGRAYIPAENRLTEADVYACCGSDAMLTRHDGPTCMGVDVGRELHVVIAERKTRDNLNVVKMCRVNDFNDLHDLAKAFNVRSCVIDLRPEQRKVREFIRSEPFSVFACEYVEMKTGITSWDEKDRVIKCNRTEICDASHDIVITPGRFTIPRMNTEIKKFAYEMCNIAKVLEERPDTGQKIYRYKKLGSSRPDHYRHATNYCLLAAERCGIISDRNIISRFFSDRRGRTWLTA